MAKSNHRGIARRIFRRFDIKAPDGSVYLRRWNLLRIPKWLPLIGDWKLMLHKMEQPDYAREMHDHPWWFCTLILRGGYIEQWRDPKTDTIGYRRNGPGMIRFNPARHMHLVFHLPRGTCWTLVLRGPRIRRWGFETDCGWMDFEPYLDRAYAGDPICEDEPERQPQIVMPMRVISTDPELDGKVVNVPIDLKGGA